jgi:hypothetical protein
MSTQTTIDYRAPADETGKVPWRERINARMIFFIAVIALLIGYPVYVMLDMQLTGGVKQLSGGTTQVDLEGDEHVHVRPEQRHDRRCADEVARAGREESRRARRDVAADRRRADG